MSGETKEDPRLKALIKDKSPNLLPMMRYLIMILGGRIVDQ